MTQQEFATQIGISQNYLPNIERGKVKIGAEILLRIGLEFGKMIEWLLTGEETRAAVIRDPRAASFEASS